jgi:formylglycine-generating enzyme required for sulfatase activity
VVELQSDAVIGGKLRLIRPLGQGGMGVVWEARHLSLDTDVAVKFIRPERIAADPALCARFEREAKTAARIAHPHVVKVMDYGAVEGTAPYIVMELLRGFTLAELLERGGRLSLATAKSLVRQVGSALESAHEHGIVHRDIKPHNVFITEGSKGYPLFVKVLDFGVAKMASQVPEMTALTETGTVIGSPPYMSPEQLEGRSDVDLRTDLWALGVIVYETLTGAQPFHGSSFVALGAAVLKGEYRPASLLRADLPASIDDWFAKALCLDPEGRFQSAREMVSAFVDLDESIAVSVPSDAAVEDARDEQALPEYATTVAAPVVTSAIADAGRTAGHAPVAKKPRSRRRVLAMMGAALVVVLAASATSVWSAGSAGCPPGMVLVPGAKFRMGSAEGADTPYDETPMYEESVDSFCIDVIEVTVRAYSACQVCEQAPMTVELEEITPNGRAFDRPFCNGADKEDHPINCISWNQAKRYCEEQGKRLPTEAEWELAARGVDRRLYPWGEAAPSGEQLNACGVECSRMLTTRRAAVGKGEWPAMHGDDDGSVATAPVGSYPAGKSPAGVLDLAGNVLEWTESAYCPYANRDCGDSRRVLRGGGWDSTESSAVRAARRYASPPSARGRSIGFRCAQTP